MGKDLFYIILSGFAGGIFLRSFFDLGKSFSVLIILLGISIISFYLFRSFLIKKGLKKIKEKQDDYFWDYQKEENKLTQQKIIINKLLTVGFIFLFFGFGILRFDFASRSSHFYDNFVGRKTSMEAVIVDEPEVKENNTQLIIKLIKLNGENVENNDKIIITTNHYPQFNYGDKIKITGVFKKPEKFKTDDTREFDYISYLAKDNIYYQMFRPKLKLISGGNGFFVKEKLFQLKKSFLLQIRKLIPEPQASLLGGLVIGAKESLGNSLKEKFRKVGLIHLVVLSGYNISIVSEFIMNTFSFLPRIFTMSFGVLGIILFALMTGASATIIRASIMALLVVLAKATGRTNQITRSLFLAGFLMLLHNPNILVFDPSFQLSFMATFGLIILSPKIEKYFQFIPEKLNLRESLVAVISTQIFVLPLLLYMMGDFSLVSVLVNLLVLVFIPVTMLLGFLTGVVGFVSAVFAIPFAYLTYGLLAYELKVVDIFASLPFASFHLSYFPFWLMLVVYGFYFILFRFKLFINSKK